MTAPPPRADDRAVPHSARRRDPGRRWLLKALRETAHEIGRLASALPGEALHSRPSASGVGEAWTAIEVACFLRHSEREDLAAVRAVLARDGAPLPERRAHLAPGEGACGRPDLGELLWGYAEAREELLWEIELAGREWEHAGVHPHRGAIALAAWVREIHERDLEALWSLRRLRSEAAAPA